MTDGISCARGGLSATFAGCPTEEAFQFHPSRLMRLSGHWSSNLALSVGYGDGGLGRGTWRTTLILVGPRTSHADDGRASSRWPAAFGKVGHVAKFYRHGRARNGCQSTLYPSSHSQSVISSQHESCQVIMCNALYQASAKEIGKFDCLSSNTWASDFSAHQEWRMRRRKCRVRRDPRLVGVGDHVSRRELATTMRCIHCCMYKRMLESEIAHFVPSHECLGNHENNAPARGALCMRHA